MTISANANTVYLVRFGKFVRIEREALPARVSELRLASPYEIEIVGILVASDELLRTFAPFHYRDGWFFLSRAIRAFIAQHCENPAPAVSQGAPKSGVAWFNARRAAFGLEPLAFDDEAARFAARSSALFLPLKSGTL